MSHVLNPEFVRQNFPEPVMPVCSIVKALRGQKAIVTGGEEFGTVDIFVNT